MADAAFPNAIRGHYQPEAKFDILIGAQRPLLIRSSTKLQPKTFFSPMAGAVCQSKHSEDPSKQQQQSHHNQQHAQNEFSAKLGWRQTQMATTADLHHRPLSSCLCGSSHIAQQTSTTRMTTMTTTTSQATDGVDKHAGCSEIQINHGPYPSEPRRLARAQVFHKTFRMLKRISGPTR